MVKYEAVIAPSPSVLIYLRCITIYLIAIRQDTVFSEAV